MASAQLYCSLFVSHYQVQILLFFRLVSLVQALEDYVGFLGFLDVYHLYLLALQRYCLREGLFAEFALEFSEVVC